MYAQSLANTAWAYAVLDLHDEPLLHAIASESIAKISDFDTMELANIAWSYARLPYKDPELLDVTFGLIMGRVDEVDYIAVHAVLWSSWATSRVDLTQLVFE